MTFRRGPHEQAALGKAKENQQRQETRQRNDKERSPAPEDDDTDRHALRSSPPYSASQSDLLIRLVDGVKALGRDVRAMRADLRVVLEEGRCHARRLTELEGRVATLEARR